MSKSLRNILSVIAMAQSIADGLEENYKDKSRKKTISKYISRIREASAGAFMLWPDEIDGKTLVRIGKRLERFGDAQFPKGFCNIAAYTSVSLALLEDILQFLNDPAKVSAINKLIGAVDSLHKYFDRKLDRHEDYKKANTAALFWQGLEA